MIDAGTVVTDRVVRWPRPGQPKSSTFHILSLFMSTSVCVEPYINDPLLTKVPLEHDCIVFPYGFPARIRSNSALVINR